MNGKKVFRQQLDILGDDANQAVKEKRLTDLICPPKPNPCDSAPFSMECHEYINSKSTVKRNPYVNI